MSKNTSREPIAIIGSGCRFPGSVNSPSQLWKILLDPVDLRQEIPSERFTSNAYYHSDTSLQGHCNVQHVYPLTEDVRHFDADFFGVKPTEAASMDPQQRLLMEVVYEGLESAGLTIHQLAGSNTGLYVGMMCDDYQTLMYQGQQDIPTYSATGTSRSIAANRISYFFDWRGPSMVLDTACSSSLVALHLAVQALRAGDSNVALAAGTNLIVGPEMFIAESNLNMLSPQSQSRMWDKSADGYARGEGITAVVLKPLHAALADGDHIECVIRDIDINQDGRTPGLTIPSSRAQVDLIKGVYRKAGLDVSQPQDRCQYFEAHGTGTPTGDPIEAEAIYNAFFGPTSLHNTKSNDQKLLVGSIKTIIGHTEGSAGLAGVLKASLALQHGLVPQNLHLEELNPSIEKFSKYLQVPIHKTPWPELPPGEPRRASVNSFGFGGTNCHVILESVPSQPVQSTSYHSLSPFCFSAQSKSSLFRNLGSFAAYLREHPNVNPSDLAYTLRSRRSALPYRISFPASSIDILRDKLQNWLLQSAPERDSAVKNSRSGPVTASSQQTRILGVFTGQGAQHARMAAELIEGFGYCAKIIDSLDSSLSTLPRGDRPTWNLRDELLKGEATTRISEAEFSQPLCTAIQILLVEILRCAGINFAAVVGHSSGEIGAAFAVGVLSRRDAIRIAYYRGKYTNLAMGPSGSAGAMMAVGTSWEDAQELCSWDEFSGKVVVAACNSPSSVTLSGDEDALKQIDVILDDEKKFRRWLKVDKAYHSSHMRPCSSPYLYALERCGIQPGSPRSGCLWVSSVDLETKGDVIPGIEGPYWNDNMVRPVQFMQAIDRVFSKLDQLDIVIEVGPHPALRAPVMDTIQKHLPKEIPYTGILSRGQSAVTSIADTWLFLQSNMKDGEVDWDNLDVQLSGASSFTAVGDLPTYQWSHDRYYWHDPPYLHRLLHKKHSFHAILGTISPESSLDQLRWRNMLHPLGIPWVLHHRLQGQAVFPAAGYVVAALEASMIFATDADLSLQFIEVRNLAIHQALSFSSDKGPGVEVLFSIEKVHHDKRLGLLTTRFSCSSSSRGPERLQLMASAEIAMFVGCPDMDLILPSPDTSGLDGVDVSKDQFYTALEMLGYGYYGPFRGLDSLQRKRGCSESLATIPTPEEHPMPHFVIHPAVLDMSIQSLLLAHSHPFDGQLGSIFVPTSIDMIRINPFALQALQRNCSDIAISASLTDKSLPSEIIGDVDIADSNKSHVAVQLQGIRAIPFAPLDPANDRQMFAKMNWISSLVDAKAVNGNRHPDPDKLRLAEVLERTACFYLRQISQESATSSAALETESLQASYMRFATHVTRSVTQGTHPYALDEWKNDRFEDIMEMTAPFSEEVEVKMSHIVGRNLAKFISGEFNMLEHFMPTGILDSYYTDSIGFQGVNVWAGEVVKEICLRHPQLNIIEIGSGTGGTTKSVLNKIGRKFAAYTFTDISSGFFPQAKEIFNSYGDKLVYQVLDISKGIADQGFSRNSYDMVVASVVLHATPCLEKALHNVRSLLKPGGILVLVENVEDEPSRVGLIFGLLPGWWAGADDGRPLSPNVSPVKWASLLRKTGFSGVDTMTATQHAFVCPFNIMVSQAVDPWVNFLRHPLWPSSFLTQHGPLDLDLVIIGGNTLHVGSLVAELEQILQPFARTITTVQTLAALKQHTITAHSTIISLADLDGAIFDNLTPASFDGLKLLFSADRAILWLTEGREAKNPMANMVSGFARSVLWEVPELHLQFLDLEDLTMIESSLIATYLIRHHATRLRSRRQTRDSYFASLERDIHVDRNLREWILRWEPLDESNARFNSTSRSITREIPLAESDVFVEKSSEGWLLRENNQSSFPNAKISDHACQCIDIRTTHSTLHAINFGPARHFLTLGVSFADGQRRMALAPLSGSRLSVNEKLAPCVLLPDESDEAQFVALVSANIICMASMAHLSPGQTVLLHNPTTTIASIMAHHACQLDVRLIITTAQPRTSTSSPWIYINPFSSQRQLKSVLPHPVDMMVDMTDTKQAGVRESKTSSLLQHYLPTSCLRLTLDDLIGSQSSTTIGALQTEQSRCLLNSAIELASSQLVTMPFNPAGMVLPAQKLSLKQDEQSFDILSVIDWTRTDTQVTVQISPIDKSLKLSPSKTYWFAGLSSSLGLSLCDWMIDHGARHFVISSRNPHIDPTWLRQARGRGVIVKIAANDITDATAMLALYNDICAELPPLAGVVQGAMVLRDSPLRDMTHEEMHAALSPKVQGSLNLDRVLKDIPLDFFIFMSSLASIIGNSGQCNYSAANAFMRSLATQRRKRGLFTATINLGLVVGLETRADIVSARQSLLTKGIFLSVSESALHQTFAEAIAACSLDSPSNGEILTELPSTRSRYSSSSYYQSVWARDPKFGGLIRNSDATATQTRDSGNQASIADRILKIRSALDLKSLVTDTFLAHLRSILDLKDDSTLNVSLRTDELGVDSLVAVLIRSWLLANFHAKVPVLRILSGITLRDLIDDVCRGFPLHLLPDMASAEDSSQGAEMSTSMVSDSTPIHDNSFEASVEASPPSSPTSIYLPIQADKTNISDQQHVRSIEDDFPPTSEMTSSTVESHRAGPASYSQSMFWFVHALMEDKTTMNHTLLYQISGKLRVQDLQRAVHALGQRHEILRTRFHVDKASGNLIQEVLTDPPLVLQSRSLPSVEDVYSAYHGLARHVYDIGEGMTMQISLLSISESNRFLLIGYHHIITDGASHFVMMTDLNKAYNQQQFDVNDPLQYLDYAKQESSQNISNEWDSEIRYWKRTLTPLPEPLPIHRSRISARLPLRQHSVHIAEITIDKRTASQIKTLAQRSRSTAFHVHLAALKALLYRFLRTGDICIGIADANRWEESRQNSIGPYINLIPLRFVADQHESFESAIENARAVTYDTLTNGRMPFEVLLNELRVARPATHTPIFQAFLDYRQEARQLESFGDLELKLLKWEVGKLPYDIFLDVNPTPSGEVIVQVMVQTSLYTQRDATILSQGYEDILAEIVASPTTSIGNQWKFRSKEIEQAIDLGRGSCHSSEWPATLLHQFENMTSKYPHKTAAKDGYGADLTYSQLMQRVNIVGSTLLRHGVHHQSRVAVYQEPSVDLLSSLLAIMKLGGVYVPLDVTMPIARLALMVDNSQPVALLVHDATAKHASGLGLREGHTFVNISELNSSSTGLAIPTCASSNRPAVILHTSGSTGKPKGVIINHSNLKSTIELSAPFWSLDSDDIVLQQSASTFDLSLGQIFQALSVGATLYIPSRPMRLDARAMVECIIRESITITLATPTEYRTWFRTDSASQLAQSSWRTALSAGESITESLLDLFRRIGKSELELYNLYGPTETSIWSTQIKLDYHSIKDSCPRGIPVGMACPNEYLYILDANLRPLPIGFPGEIAIGGLGVASGYLNLDKETKESFIPDPVTPGKLVYRTKDQGRLLSDGALILHGRLDYDTEVKLRGVRIDLQEIEQVILQVGEGYVLEVAVSRRSSSDTMHSFLVAHVVLDPTKKAQMQESFSLDSLRQKLPLPEVMCPSIMVPVTSLPQTVSAKLDRRALENLPISSSLFEQRRLTTSLSIKLQEIKFLWRDVIPNDILQHHEVHPDTDFFHVGGNSMLLIDLHTRICEKYQASTITLFQLFQFSTLRGMTELLQNPNQAEEDQTASDIDWESEIALSSDLSFQISSTSLLPVNLPPQTVVLTGATGFIGQSLLESLVTNPHIKKVICLAVRSPNGPRGAFLHANKKAEVVEGDLSLPHLGTSEAVIRDVIKQADAVVHNGADISQAKSYRSIRPTNFASTKTLVNLCSPRRIPFHYVSTTAISVFSTLGSPSENQTRASKPPVDGSLGYIASKWASEMYLDRVCKHLSHMPVSVYRPSSIIRREDSSETSSSDFTHDLIGYSRRMRAVPDLRNIDGHLNLVPVETVVDAIIQGLFASRPAGISGPHYQNVIGNLDLPFNKLREHMYAEAGVDFDILPLTIWISRAREIGMSDGMAAVFEGLNKPIL